MDDNYCTPLAAILRKAQGCIYRGTDEFIDVGGEVSELRRICDSQRATISRLRTELTEARKPDCLLCKNYYEREDENDHSLYRGCALRLRLTPSDCINGSDFISVGPVRLYEREENA